MLTLNKRSNFPGNIHFLILNVYNLYMYIYLYMHYVQRDHSLSLLPYLIYVYKVIGSLQIHADFKYIYLYTHMAPSNLNKHGISLNVLHAEAHQKSCARTSCANNSVCTFIPLYYYHHQSTTPPYSYHIYRNSSRAHLLISIFPLFHSYSVRTDCATHAIDDMMVRRNSRVRIYQIYINIDVI